MKRVFPENLQIHPEVSLALKNGGAVVALESAVITHGLPRPVNLETAREMETIIREMGVTPATTALIDGKLVIGATGDELARLASEDNLLKVSTRNLAIGMAQKRSGGTTVAATCAAARLAGIKVFATGGIGGVHRGNPSDVSADLDALAHNEVIVVCAGAKSILDLPATLEALDTRGVPVLGYQTDEFPAFYTRQSGLKVDGRIQSALEAARIARLHWNAGFTTSILVCNPIPADDALNSGIINQAIESAVRSAASRHIKGADLTPFLLARLSEVTSGQSLQANLALLKNNAVLAAEIAKHFSEAQMVSF